MYKFLLFTCLCLSNLSIFAQEPTAGLIFNTESAFPSYTLFGNNETTYLIDNCGLIVNTWQSDYQPGQAMYLLENGDLLRTAEIEGTFNAGGAGGRFELFNWEGDLIWFYELSEDNKLPHHDIAPLPNGNFLAIVWERKTEQEAQAIGRQYDGEVWSERIIEVEILANNKANIVWEWELWNHLIQDVDGTLPNYGVIKDHPELVNINYIGVGEDTHGNWIHLNAIDYNEDLEQIAVSSRLFSEIWVLDHSVPAGQTAAHTGGRYGKGGDLLYRYGNPQAYNQGSSDEQVFSHQHDIKWIPNGLPNAGQFMVFNNDNAANASSIERWSPPIDLDGHYMLNDNGIYGPVIVDWEYTADDFYSRYMSSAQMLPNGHLFICEGASGHFFEINPAGEVVWDYINPVNPNGGPIAQGGTIRFNQTFRATKYGLDYPAFLNKNLEPSIPVEINPWESDCFIAEKDTVQLLAPSLKVLGNPMSNWLQLEFLNSKEVIELQIYDIMGRRIRSFSMEAGQQEFDVSSLSSGIYLLEAKLLGVTFFIKKIFIN